jgi:hypothetical protein
MGLLIEALQRLQGAHRIEQIARAKRRAAGDRPGRETGLLEAFDAAEPAADRPDNRAAPGNKAIRAW